VCNSLASLAAACIARDHQGLAEQFTPKGEFIDADGDVFEGRDAIAREFAPLFQINPRNAAEMAARAIREISPGILSVDVVASFSAAEGSESVKFEKTNHSRPGFRPRPVIFIA